MKVMDNMFNHDRKMTRYITSGLLAILMLITTGTVDAQRVTYFEIRDGSFILNGKTMTAKQLPETIDGSGLNATFSFFGDSHPVIEIKGRFFVLEEGSIRDAKPEDLERGDVNLFLTDSEVRSNMIREAYRVQVDALHENARKLEKYTSSEPIQKDGEMARLISEAQRSTELAASMAEQLPQAEMQRYWEDLRFRDGELYAKVNHELKMEIQAREMAAKIRNMPDTNDPERQALIDELRSTIEEIYVLKQANRKREIVELQTQLLGLEKNMRDREKYKTEIIERRLQDLLGEDTSRW